MLNKAFIITLCLFIFGCGEGYKDPNLNDFNEGNRDRTVAPPAQKPALPTDCSDIIDLKLRWTPDNSGTTAKYRLSVGQKFGNYYQTIDSTNGLVGSVSVNLKRGGSYFVKIEKNSARLQPTICKNYHLIIPTCDQRLSWAGDHLKYYEPLFYNILWEKQNSQSCSTDDSEQNF